MSDKEESNQQRRHEVAVKKSRKLKEVLIRNCYTLSLMHFVEILVLIAVVVG